MSAVSRDYASYGLDEPTIATMSQAGTLDPFCDRVDFMDRGLSSAERIAFAHRLWPRTVKENGTVMVPPPIAGIRPPDGWGSNDSYDPMWLDYYEICNEVHELRLLVKSVSVTK